MRVISVAALIAVILLSVTYYSPTNFVVSGNQTPRSGSFDSQVHSYRMECVHERWRPVGYSHRSDRKDLDDRELERQDRTASTHPTTRSLNGAFQPPIVTHATSS